MYILKNAITSIQRNKGRNVLIGIIILVISCAVSITLAINNASDSLIESYENKYEVEATLGFNRNNMMKDFNPEDRDNSQSNMEEMFSSANSVTEEEIELYADSKYVKDYYYTISVGVDLEDIEKASMSSSNDGGRGNGGFNMFGGMGPGNFSMSSNNSNFTLKGYSSITSMTEFIEGNYKIIDGEVSEDFEDNSCLINNELATLNSLAVGDTITVIDENDTSKTYELVISGIYEEDDDDNAMSMYSSSVNTVITNTNFVKKLKENDEDLKLSTEPTFILTSKDVIEDFEDELVEKGLNENLSVSTNLDIVESATSTISNVKKFSTTFLIVTLMIGTVVLLVINMINIRERKYEIGVLRTIGMKKSKVCAQFILELVMVSAIFLLVGAGIGATLSVPVSNSLLESEIESSQNQTNDIGANFGKDGGFDFGSMGNMPSGGNMPNKGGFQGVATVSAFDSIDATVNFKVLLELLGIGMVLTLISSISAVTSIQKFSPLTILKERS